MVHFFWLGVDGHGGIVRGTSIERRRAGTVWGWFLLSAVGRTKGAAGQKDRFAASLWTVYSDRCMP